MRRIAIYDATLRDGAQGEGVSFSPMDKLRFAEQLDALGIDYIEGGFPGSNPKDREFFRAVRDLPLKHIKIAAFGSTRRPSNSAANDPGLNNMIAAKPDAATIFGKTWKLHVTDVLRVKPGRNLRMIEDSVALLKNAGLEVIYDAEHFFDGYKDDPSYAVTTLYAAQAGGADVLVLCDTNGGTVTTDITRIIEEIKEQLSIPLGIHSHNDIGMAVASSVAAVETGALHVQGTINGYGERCGNADLCSIIPTLELKLGLRTIGRAKLRRLTEFSRWVSETANIAPDATQPYVGVSAFAHKGGMHIDAVKKNERTFEHIEPKSVGNERRILISELAGRSAIVDKAKAYAKAAGKDTAEIQGLFRQLREMEHEGYQFEGAEASFDLLIMKAFKKHRELFHRAGFRVITERRESGLIITEATIKVSIGDQVVHTAAEGDGPVNALDTALRKALAEAYPEIRKIHLVDYKVRVLDASEGTAAKVRVLIQSTDGRQVWGTVGVSENVIEASWKALVDSVEYGLLYRKFHRRRRRT